MSNKQKAFKVNERGLREIRALLSKRHKLFRGCLHIERSVLNAWADDAEFQLAQGNPASIEIRAYDSVSGHIEEYTITDAGLHWEDDPDDEAQS